MSNQRNDGHNWQAPLPQQIVHRKDPQAQVDVCYNFVWGICQDGAKCKYRHELDIAVMRNMEIFCYSFQRFKYCPDTDCVYIHATKQQVYMFWLNGKIPKALAVRHPVLQASSRSTVQYGVQTSSQEKWQLFSPLPPPRQEPVTSQTHPKPRISPTANSNYAVTCLPSTAGSMSQGHLPSRFDTSRPPPDWPHNAARKRRFDDNRKAGPSKVRRREEPGQDPTDNDIATGSTEQLREILHKMNQSDKNFEQIHRRWADETMTPQEEADFKNKFLSRLLVWVIKKEQTQTVNTTNVDQPIAPTSSINNVLLESIVTPRRRQTPDGLTTFLEALRKSSASGSSQERNEPPAPFAVPSANPSDGHSATSEWNTESALPPAPAVHYPPVSQNAPRSYPAPTAQPATAYPPYQPAAAYPPYQPAVPPPAVNYYTHQHYHAAAAAATPTAAPVPVYPSSRAAAPPAAPAPAHNYYTHQYTNAVPTHTAAAQHSSQYVYTQWYQPYPEMLSGPPGLPHPAPPEETTTPPFPPEMYGPTAQDPHNGNYS